MHFAPFYVTYATEVVGITANLNLISGVVAMVLDLPMGQIVDNWMAKCSVLIGILATPATIYQYQYADNYLIVVAVIVVIAPYNKIMIPGFSTLISNRIPSEKRACC